MTRSQWEAWREVFIEGRTQAQTGKKFGIKQPAISRRIQRYCHAAGIAHPFHRGRGRKKFVRPMQLSLADQE